ncbi:MAG: bifunctional sugar phosphate isomerase/epimerase/4-hydroxyphenylpyruvate dioxygenase family protein [Alphaproteobacteria bacterium]
MRTSIATVSLSGDLAEKLEAIAHAGFHGLEIFESDFLTYDRDARTVGRMIRDAGLVPTLFQPFRDFEGLPEPDRARAFDRAERKFDLMGELGAETMLVCSSVAPQAVGGIDRAAADLRALGERAARRGLRIGYEALAWGRFVNDHRDAWEVVRRADHPAVGLILDSFHTLARRIEIDSIRAIPADKLFAVQLADAPAMALDALSWSRHFRNMPGQGDLPLVAFMRAIRATGYDGTVSLEIFNDQFRAGSARAVAIDGRRSLIALAQAAGPATIDGIATEEMPPRAAVEGVEFVEFATDDAGAGALEGQLAAMGFARRGRHRSKAVAVWSRGSANVVVNRERTGFAHSFFLTHGPGVCAICLRVDNAERAMARARALLATPFGQAVIPGELEIPAIRGVGGSLLYFVDGISDLGRLWSTDFLLDQPAATGAGICAVDHVAQSMALDEMLSWLLFYRSILAVEKISDMEVADPAGLVHSQAVQTPDGALRLVLNGSQGMRTAAARFVTEFFGSGVQHLAFASGDLRATARAMKSSGMRTLPIPANYYDDLDARFGLDPDFLAELRALGLLYDRDADGDYLQLYAPALDDRFFFEIVERRAYGGFGAANAAVRLAAQARLAPSGALAR